MGNQLLFKTSNADGPLCGFSTLFNYEFMILGKFSVIGVGEYIIVLELAGRPNLGTPVRGD